MGILESKESQKEQEIITKPPLNKPKVGHKRQDSRTFNQSQIENVGQIPNSQTSRNSKRNVKGQRWFACFTSCCGSNMELTLERKNTYFMSSQTKNDVQKDQNNESQLPKNETNNKSIDIKDEHNSQ